MINPFIQLLRNACVVMLTLTLAYATPVLAQEAPPTIYLEITKRQTLNDDFMDTQKELVQPFVQQRIKQGTQIAHGVFRVHFPRGEGVNYNYVTMDVYGDFDHLHMGWDKMVETASAAFPNVNMPKMVERYESAAEDINSEVFMIRNEAYPGPATGNGKPPKFVAVNYMHVPAGKGADYLAMENEIFKPIHQARAKDDLMADWVLAQRVFPYGTEWKYNYITFDIFSDWKSMGAGGLDTYFTKAHPNKNADEVWEKMMGLRDLGRSEIWELVSWTNTPPVEVAYDVVKEGTGMAPMNGQEVAYRVKTMNTKGETLFDSGELGFPFYVTIGESPYDRYFDTGLRQVKKGGIINITIPPEEQDENTLAQSGGQPMVAKVEVLDIGMPQADGAKLLKEIIEEHGLAAAQEKYQKLQSSNSDGYTFREGPMNNLGYELMADGKVQAAHFIFVTNQKNYPKSWNAWDSLADCHMAGGNTAKAKECYQKSLEINPEFKAAKDKLTAMDKM